MTDEPREETQDEEQDVEGHGAINAPISGTIGEKSQVDEDDDVEAHSPPIPAPPLPAPPLP